MMYTMLPYRTRPTQTAAMMNRVLRDLFDAPVPQQPTFRVDVRQNDDVYLIEAELPGVKLEDIDITVENDMLTITADMNTTARTEKEGYLRTERRSGHLVRSFDLTGIRQSDITAATADGILTITLPKEAPETGKEKRKIAITAPNATPVLEAGETA